MSKLIKILFLLFVFLNGVNAQEVKSNFSFNTGLSLLVYSEAASPRYELGKIRNEVGFIFGFEYAYTINKFVTLSAELNYKQNRLTITTYHQLIRVNNNSSNIPSNTIISDLDGTIGINYSQIFLPINLKFKLSENFPIYSKIGFGISPTIVDASRGGHVQIRFYDSPTSSNPNYEKLDEPNIIKSFLTRNRYLEQSEDIFKPAYILGIGSEFSINNFNSSLELRFHKRLGSKSTLLRKSLFEDYSLELMFKLFTFK